MDRFIALYRGINVGGHNPVKMESLRALHEALGHRKVASYIQSGNLVFDSSGTPRAIAKATAARFAMEFGFAAHVLVVPGKRWASLISDNPFASIAAETPKLVHACICDGKPDAVGLKALQSKTGGGEAFVTQADAIYLHTPVGVGNSRFAAGMEKACGVPITTRNWRTVEALAKLLDF